MKSIGFKKLSVLVMILMLVLPTLSLDKVFADETTPTSTTSEGNSPSQTTRYMIDFFRIERTTIQADRVAVDEYMVYGVFLSNFFVPWSTTLKDMVDTSSENSIPNRVSKKFFGSTGNSTQVLELNKKLYDSIHGVLGHNKELFTLYADSNHTKPMTGQMLFDKLSGKDSKPTIWGNEGSTLMDLSDKATKSSWQIVFGISPEYMIAEDKGLRTLDGLYMDGLGNIWGSYKNSPPNDYVLVFPAVLNPSLYGGSPGYFKFPVSNVFVMGGALKMTHNFLDGKNQDGVQGNDYFIPYYNINDYIPQSTSGADAYNTGNVVNIFGVQSPLDYIGRSDDIINEGVDENPYTNKVSSFLESSSSSIVTERQASVIVSTDLNQIKNVTDKITKDASLTKEQRFNLIKSLTSTQVFNLNQVADYMYYFDVPLASSENATDSTMGSFDKVEELIRKQKLFAMETETQGEYTFYDGAFVPSPFNGFLKSFNEQKGDTAKHKFLEDTLGRKFNTDSAEYKALVSFLSKGTWGTKDAKVIMKAMQLLIGDSRLAWGILPPVTEPSQVVTEEGWFGLNLSSEFSSFGLTAKDYSTLLMSFSAKDDSLLADFQEFSTGKAQPPFYLGINGGEIDISTIPDEGSKRDNATRAISTLFHNFMTYRIFSMNTTFATAIDGTASGKGTYQTAWGEMQNKTAIMDGKNHYPGMYWGLMVELLGIESSDGKLDTTKSFGSQYLPNMEISTLGGSLDLSEALGSQGVSASDDKTLAEMQEDIIHKIYGLLTDGPNSYRDSLIKSTQNSWLISTHRAITGSWVGDVVSVSNGANGSYASVVGYINTPTLTELPLTDWVLKDYVYIYMLFLLIILILLIMMVLTNMRSLREGVLILIFMSFVLILPQFLVGNIINISNKIGDVIYSDRFNYWAIVQHEQSVQNKANARMSGDEMDYIIAGNMEAIDNAYSNDVGVRVRWMSPKKDDTFDSIFNKNTASEGLMSNLTIFRWLFNSYFNQEEYVYGDPLATYVYRPYNAIASEAEKSYEALKDAKIDKTKTLEKVVANESNVLGLPSYRFNYYKKPEGKITYSEERKQLIEDAKPFNTATNIGEDQIESYRYWLLNNNELTKAIFRSNFSSSAGYVGNTQDPYYNAFSLTTESPYYYFYNMFKHRYAYGTADFKSALLDEDMFKSTSTDMGVDGELRDFLDLEGLFTYVVPYLHQGNDYVYGWTNLYGKDINTFNFDGSAAPDDPELAKRYAEEKNKKENLKNVWKLYSPWVDQIYSLDGALSAKARVADETVYIEDAFNPASYEEVGRPMLFSPADMRAKGYSYADLSDVEARIQFTLQETYKDLLYLTNYYDFDDEVLVTAAAMIATFNFNEQFSEYKFLGESVTLYPQNFELKNFNYDAFMRLMLLNATGEPLMAEEDLYVRILDNTSFFTGVLLILCDVMAVIVVPTIKIVVLLLLLFLSILISISCIITPPEKLVKTILKHLGLPSLLFLIASVSFAYVVSLFMGEGLTGYVGSRTPELGISDPTIMMGLMVVVDLVYLYVLWRITKLLLESAKSFGTSTVFSSMALVAGAGTSIVSGVKDVYKSSRSKSVSKHRHEELVDAMRGSSGSGDSGGSGRKYRDPDYSSPSVSPALDTRISNTDSVSLDRSSDGLGGKKDLRQEIDELASGRNDSPQEKKPLGHKIVDAAHTIRDLPSDIKDGVKYATSSQGLSRDAKSKVRNTSRTVREKASNYANNVRQYSADRELGRIVELDKRKNYSSNVSKRQDRSFERISNIENKINNSYAKKKSNKNKE